MDGAGVDMSSPKLSPPGRPSAALGGVARRLWRSWATRSLAVGAIATALDVGVGVAFVNGLMAPTRLGAMAGVAIGAAFTFFASRFFAFREHDPSLARPAVRFLLATGLAMLVHGQLVVLLRDGAGVPFVLAKLVADVGVFTVGQLFLLRYLVFPKRKPSLAIGLEPSSFEG